LKQLYLCIIKETNNYSSLKKSKIMSRFINSNYLNNYTGSVTASGDVEFVNSNASSFEDFAVGADQGTYYEDGDTVYFKIEAGGDALEIVRFQGNRLVQVG